MKLDVITVLFAALICLVGIISIFVKTLKIKRHSIYIRLLFIGLLLVFIVTILNGVKVNKWDKVSLINFISLREVGDLFFRQLLSLGYIFVVWAVFGLLASRFRKKQINSEIKQEIKGVVYINAFFESLKVQYNLTLILFLILPVSMLFLSVSAVNFQTFANAFLSLIFLSLIIILLRALIQIWKKFWVLKIVVSDSGILFDKLFYKKYIEHADILSCEIPMKGMLKGKIAKIKTRHINLYFPLTMKIEKAEFPKISSGFFEWKWKDADGAEKPVVPENCPLYIEIQSRLSKRLTDVMGV